MSKLATIKKVLVLGSGAIKIGEAGEFDYSGSQALKALKEEEIESVLLNPNIATIQTDQQIASKVHLLPITPEFAEEVIQIDRPDGILLGFGGQTALNCGVQLAKRGILDRYGVKVLGTPIRGIEITEDRDLFKQTMKKASLPTARSQAGYSVEEAREVASEIGYPVMVRAAYTLGGRGGGVAHNEIELDEIVLKGLASSMTHQVLIEEYLGGWKQVEYEVMRDIGGNGVTVCNMENILGMRVHTGDNIVVAPSQTLNNREYHLLRTVSLAAAKACGIVGECNVQFALNPSSESYKVIEINARLSRSSALASKATGYPLAYLATKLALGYRLSELTNKVTGVTTACFEPSLDYVVVKMPRWDLKKFARVSRRIGTQMKSVGEVMAIARKFEEAIQKAARMLDIGRPGVNNPFDQEAHLSLETLEARLTHPDDEIIFTIVSALRFGMSVEEIERLSEVDRWFIFKLNNIIQIERTLKKLHGDPDRKLLLEAKSLGFSDAQIGSCLGMSELEVRKKREAERILPSLKQIDTLGAEWPARTNYLYLSYDGDTDDTVPTEKKKAIVLGAGAYHIGSSVEFDWSTMNMVWGLRERGIEEVSVVNCNPETVSTDYDMSDNLFFEEITLERILDIYNKQDAVGIVTCVGGQAANSLLPKLAKQNVRILGTDSENVDTAEDRSKFSALLDKLEIPQPSWRAFSSLQEAYAFAKSEGYPLLVRPSYVLSGAAMKTVWSSKHLREFLAEAAKVSPEHPVVISKFILEAKEAEVDAVSDGNNVFIGAVIEHIEKAGIHSGDAMMCIPPRSLNPSEEALIIDYTNRIGKALQIKGPFNVQFLVKSGNVYVIECNLRASRSMPFVSKFTGINLMKMSASAILGETIPSSYHHYRRVPFVGVKVPQFSFMQLDGADPILGVEMQSTGEVACYGKNFYDAFLKALLAAGYEIPRKKGSILVSVGGHAPKAKILPIAKKFRRLGFKVFATEHTANFLSENGVESLALYKIGESSRKPNVEDYLVNGELDLIINIPVTRESPRMRDIMEDEYLIRRKAVELGIPVLTTIEGARVFVEGLEWLGKNKLTIEVSRANSDPTVLSRRNSV
jgi:carbamoyl-phosphate synthase large subunit